MDSNFYARNSSVQSANARLVSDLAPQPSTFASVQQPEQLEAIETLKGEEDTSIFAWLTLARSLKRGSECRSDHQYLTHDQLRAIDALRYCDSDDIHTWLHWARIHGRLSHDYMLAMH